MKTRIILVSLVLLMFRAGAQNNPKKHAQCRFSDGHIIRITYSFEHSETRLTTDEDLVAVTGIEVPAGEYVVSTSKDPRGNWILTMKKEAGAKSGFSQLPPLPMSVNTSGLPIEKFNVSFDQTGGSCKMLWGLEKSNVVLSFEFSERNADIRVLGLRQVQKPEPTRVIGGKSAK